MKENIRKEVFRKRLIYAMDIVNTMSSTDLSYKTKIPKSSISQYRNGYTTPSTARIKAIANVLGVNEVWLTGFDVPMLEDKETDNTSELSTSIGKRIKALRDEHNYSVRYVAEELGISDISYVRMEQGNDTTFNIELIFKIANIYNVPIYTLMDIFKPVKEMNKNLVALRKITATTIKDLSNALGITENSYINKEDGNEQITHSDIEKICDYYKIDLTMFIGMDLSNATDRQKSMIITLYNSVKYNFSETELKEIETFINFVISKR